MTDDYKQGLITGMAMQPLAVTVPTYATLYDGLHGGWDFSNGITGLQKIVNPQQTRSTVGQAEYTTAARVMRISKDYSIAAPEDGYTDTIVIRTNEKINFTPYSKMRVLAVAFKNYSILVNSVYFKAGDVEGAISNQPYDFSEWLHICNSNISTTDYNNPSTPTWYEIDVSALTGSQYINFGLYHGSQVQAYSVYFDIHEIVMVI